MATFKHPYHRKIATILAALNLETFQAAQAWFAGGTRIALEFDEFRWSKDIDFLCCSGDPYREFRARLLEDGYRALFANTDDFDLPREIQTNQNGVRFPVLIDNTTIKFEIINEARVALGSPVTPTWSAVPCLNLSDCVTEKLLANADRWADRSTEARDVIDLCVLRRNVGFDEAAIEKAEAAYPVMEPLTRAVTAFQTDANYRQQTETRTPKIYPTPRNASNLQRNRRMRR